MYAPEIFRERDEAIVAEFLRANPLGALVTVQDGVPQADHIPFLYDPAQRRLRAHVARANPLWRAHDARISALVIFSGGAHYVMPSWYATKRETGRVVPTWNYEVAHIYGPLRAHDDPAFTRALIEDLTRKHEADRAAPWAVSDAPEEFVEQQLRAIVGVEIAVERIEMKRKLSQNRTPADIEGVIAGLGAEGDAGTAMAQRMAALRARED
jgi:transcriptional regulator